MATSDWQAAAALLRQGIEQLALTVDDQQQCKMINFIQLLKKWNQRFNLTSITDWRGMVIKHLLDSLAISPWITSPMILDVGSGAGIPGIPLAILQQDKAFTLLDSNGKKTRFINQATTELGLQNVSVVRGRIERYQPSQAFDQVICRAYASLQKFVEQTENILHPDIELLAMKGQLPESELQQLNELSGVKTDIPDTIATPNTTDTRMPADNLSAQVKITVTEIHKLQVPFLNEQRHLVRLAVLKLANR